MSVSQDEDCFFVFNRNSDRLGKGVLYASVNPEYFSAAESECVCVCCGHSGNTLCSFK